MASFRFHGVGIITDAGIRCKNFQNTVRKSDDALGREKSVAAARIWCGKLVTGGGAQGEGYCLMKAAVQPGREARKAEPAFSPRTKSVVE